MNQIKEKILKVALQLYNQRGVANTSMRQLAKEVNISHSHLMYHFPSHEDVIIGLHDQLLKAAITLNRDAGSHPDTLTSLWEITIKGFGVVYQYRFLFMELPFICARYPKVKQTILAVEEKRSDMYGRLMQHLIRQKLMRPETFDGEFNLLIQHIKIFSDHWLVSAAIYDDMNKKERIEKYAVFLMGFFYPYLTATGKAAWDKLPCKAHLIGLCSTTISR